jgi:hypothetical protein
MHLELQIECHWNFAFDVFMIESIKDFLELLEHYNTLDSFVDLFVYVLFYTLSW